MKKIYLSILFAAVFALAGMAQDEETYAVLKVTGNNVPVIDGEIDAVWDNIEIAVIEKTTEMDLPEPEPTPDDISGDFSLLWNEDGLYVRYKVVDDITVIFEDYDPGNDIPADQWWTDDFNSLMFSSDLINETFESYEFAWQMGIDQEVKLSSDDWLNAALVDISLVNSAWYNEGTTWILEAFIDWDCFPYAPEIEPGLEFQMDASLSDDDDDGVTGDSWNSRLQWSSTESGSVFTGLDWGKLTLSATEVETTGVKSKNPKTGIATVYPNPSYGSSQLKMNLSVAGDVVVSVFNLSGKLMREDVLMNRSAGENVIEIDLDELSPGMYFLDIHSSNQSEQVKIVRQ